MNRNAIPKYCEHAHDGSPERFSIAPGIVCSSSRQSSDLASRGNLDPIGGRYRCSCFGGGVLRGSRLGRSAYAVVARIDHRRVDLRFGVGG